MDNALKMIIFAVGVIIAVALIAVGFNVFSSSKGVANDGTVQLQETIGMLNESTFTDYDQKTVSGSQVTSAYNQFNGKAVAVIVKTCRGSWKNYNALISPFTATTGGEKTSTIPFSGISKDATTKQITSSESFFNKTAAGVETTLVLSTAADSEKQTMVYNSTITEMTKTGNVNYVTPTAKFNAYLVKDAGDGIIGVVFIQQGKHTA